MKGSKIFFDTNIICYAFDLNEPSKREACEELVKRVAKGELIGVVSNQVLGEVFNAATSKLKISPEDANIIVQTIIKSDKWQKINYSHETISRAAEKFERLRVPFWDLLITETMKENGIDTILTENEKDFNKVEGITVKNPLA